MIEPGRHLDAMRRAAPLVQCVSNFVAMNFAANALLAAGARPAMVHNVHEAGEFAAMAGAVAINIGTLSPDWLEGMEAAARGAQAAGVPWALDPVACGATRFRRESALGLLALGPDLIRANASEILALAGEAASRRGVDAGDPVGAAEAAARALARDHGAVVAVTGQVDFVTDGARAARVANGAALMARVTATGCALTCLVAAFAAAVPDRFEATLAALAFYAVAGERAAASARGPGSFPPLFLDALDGLDGPGLDAAARIAPA